VKVVKYLILLLLVLAASDWMSPTLAIAKSSIPASYSKIKHTMVVACTKREKSCSRHTRELNQCIRKAAYRPISRPSTSGGAVCAMIYQPVCALTANGNLQIYSNDCVANNAGASQVPFEQCESK